MKRIIPRQSLDRNFKTDYGKYISSFTLKDSLGIPRRLPFCIDLSVVQKGKLDITRTLVIVRILIPATILLLAFIQTLMSAVTPEFIRSLPPLPADAAVELAKHENWPLATGKIDIATVTDNNDIGYGITPDEIKDAITEGFLPDGYKFPRRMTKEEADRWYWRITLPTYRSIVRKTVKVPLTLDQEASLVFFALNVGRNNLKTAVDQPGRLNDGNYGSIEWVMPLYYEKERPEKAGLQKRLRFMLAVYKGQPFARKG